MLASASTNATVTNHSHIDPPKEASLPSNGSIEAGAVWQAKDAPTCRPTKASEKRLSHASMRNGAIGQPKDAPSPASRPTKTGDKGPTHA